MARPVTLAELVSAARLRANMATASLSSTSFVTDTEVEGYVQASATHLYDLILSAWGERYFFDQTDLTTTIAQATVALPSDFYRVLKVGWVHSSTTDPTRLEPFQDDEEWSESWGTPGSWSQHSTPRYQVRSHDLWLDPTPSSVETLRLQYVPIMPEIDDTGPPPVTFQGVNGWEEFIVLDVAIKLRIKEESSVSDLQKERTLQMGRIQEMAPRRDVGRTHKVQRRRATRGRR